jgi:hypothetical protein
MVLKPWAVQGGHRLPQPVNSGLLRRAEVLLAAHRQRHTHQRVVRQRHGPEAMDIVSNGYNVLLGHHSVVR